MRNSLKVAQVLSGSSPSQAIWSTYPDDQIAYYLLSEESGSTSFADSLGLGANLTSFGTVTAGVTGVGDGNTAVQMGPGSSRINSADAYFKNNIDGDKGSMACFFKFDAGSASQPIAIFNADNSSYLTIEKNTSDVLSFTRRVAGTYYACSVDISLEMSTDFVHLGATWDQAAGETRLYINGVQRASRDGAMNSWDASTEASLSFRVGWAFGDPHAVAHVVTWSDRVLSVSDFLRISQAA